MDEESSDSEPDFPEYGMQTFMEEYDIWKMSPQLWKLADDFTPF